MTQTEGVTETLNGLFRGICVDNKDPRNLGRIRVQVPQILGTQASGWAFPAWSIHETTVWPQDRLPKPGEGVWVMFDSTSPDKMIWVAAFGALDLINQPGFAPDIEYTSTSTLSLTGTPNWNTTVTFSGVLGSDGGVPNPAPEVRLQYRLSGGTTWTTLRTISDVDPITGAWSTDYLISVTGNVEYRAYFPGVGVYSDASSDVISVNTPVVTFNTNLTLSINDPSPALGKSSEFRGNLTAVGAPAGYGIPKDAKISFQSRTPGGSWSQVVGNIPVNATTGAWTTNYTISVAGSVEYRAVFSGYGIYVASTSSTLTVNTSQSTVVSTPSLPTLYHGTGFTVTGTVKTSGGASVPLGTAQLWCRNTVGADTAWKMSASSAMNNGTYSLTSPSLSTLGATQWQVRYVGTTQYLDSTSTSVSATVNLRPNAALTKGSVSHSSAAISWAATSGATHYNVEYQINGGSWQAAPSGTRITATNKTTTGLSSSTSYGFRVQPTAQDPAGVWLTGGWSSTVTMNTGRAEQRDSGATGWVTITSQLMDSHRKDVGWGFVSDMRQGFFSSSYDGEGYIGISKYTGTRVRDAIRAACGGGTLGTTRQNNGTCTAAEISLRRGSAVGDGITSGPVVIGFRTTTSSGTGGRPTLDGSFYGTDSTNPSASTYSWHDIGTAHGQRIGDAGANSIAMYRNSKANYANFEAGNLRLKWSWNYVTVSYIAPSWS